MSAFGQKRPCLREFIGTFQLYARMRPLPGVRARLPRAKACRRQARTSASQRTDACGAGPSLWHSAAESMFNQRLQPLTMCSQLAANDVRSCPARRHFCVFKEAPAILGRVLGITI